MKRTCILLTVVLVLAGVVVGVFWFQLGGETDKLISENLKGQQEKMDGNNKAGGKGNVSEPSTEYSIRPDFSKVKDFKNTLSLQKGVSVKYGDGWVGKKMENPENIVSGQLIKTVGNRSYEISLGEIEYALPVGNIDNFSLKLYDETLSNNKPYAIVVSSYSYSDEEGDFAYISSCSTKEGKACPISLQKTNLLIMLRQNIAGAQEPKGLNFSRNDDQQILSEFSEIASTLQY